MGNLKQQSQSNNTFSIIKNTKRNFCEKKETNKNEEEFNNLLSLTDKLLEENQFKNALIKFCKNQETSWFLFLN